MLRSLVILLGMIAAPIALAADTAGGTIEICRVAQAGDKHKDLTIEIPLGAAFGDSGSGLDHRGNYWPLWIATAQAVTIHSGEKCASTAARITGNLDRHRLKVADDRWFMPTIGKAGDLPDWPGNLLLSATALTDFR
jgi:hypothetical protein